VGREGGREGGEGRTDGERRGRAKETRESGLVEEETDIRAILLFCSSKPLLFTFLKPLAF
jgi:hypothetical protein